MHIAPLVTKAFDHGSVYGYRCFLAVGQLAAMRSAFFRIREHPELLPAVAWQAPEKVSARPDRPRLP